MYPKLIFSFSRGMQSHNSKEKFYFMLAFSKFSIFLTFSSFKKFTESMITIKNSKFRYMHKIIKELQYENGL